MRTRKMSCGVIPGWRGWSSGTGENEQEVKKEIFRLITQKGEIFCIKYNGKQKFDFNQSIVELIWKDGYQRS